MSMALLEGVKERERERGREREGGRFLEPNNLIFPDGSNVITPYNVITFGKPSKL